MEEIVSEKITDISGEKSHPEIAEALFLEGYNCAQSVFCAFCDVTGLEMETALKLSSSFGGGIGRMRDICGACLSMFMVAGCVDGYNSPNDDTAKGKHYARIQKLAAEFKRHCGTMCCRELLSGLEVSDSPTPTPRTADFYKTRPCAGIIRTAAEILDDNGYEKRHRS